MQKLLEDFSEIAVGGTMCTALTKNGEVYWWGEITKPKFEIVSTKYKIKRFQLYYKKRCFL